MQHEPNPHQDPVEPGSGETPGPRRWKAPGAALSVGLAAFLAMAGAGVAFAVTGPGTPAGSSASGSSASGSSGSGSSGSGATGPAVSPRPMGGPGGGHRMGPGGPGMGLGRVVHGQFTVPNGTGYKTLEIQTGVVQPGKTSTSITVLSSDRYSQRYTVQSSTVVDSQAGGISAVDIGDTVRVEAVQQSDGTFTATDIVDTSKIASSRRGFGFTPPARPGPSPSQQSSPAA